MSQGLIRLSLGHWIMPLQDSAYATRPDGETGSRPTATQQEPAGEERWKWLNHCVKQEGLLLFFYMKQLY